ncbi:MAG: SDR family oxidoreductase [Actinomycetota bacterium]|jgi:UDP-glucose 4-epimerase|nr:SDR family oxidoreductase [Actinomycetota bacterium]MCL6093620.1 SDR family oxidoreductase [Actinomycetota bacterium]MDA8166915.1 SDR family oxidoreductase [Actinomycetota bacterium]
MKEKMVLITGANGFLGRHLCAEMYQQGWRVKAATRSVDPLIAGAEPVMVGSIDGGINWADALSGVDAVVHLAARVHVIRDDATNPLAEFRAVNVGGTLNLARQAVKAGVRRFLFLSSIGVNGHATQGVPFDESSEPAPHSEYSVSKYEAEQGLQEIAAKSVMEIIIIRAPLVYGPSAPGNFAKLINFTSKSYPLPLGAIRNRRSFVSTYNLLDFIVTCLDHPAAANQTFLVSDGEDLSTTELLRRLAAALNVPTRLLPVPQKLLEAGFKIVGKSVLAQRLCGSLQVDITKARTMLDWNPPVSVDEGLRITAEHFLRGRG